MQPQRVFELFRKRRPNYCVVTFATAQRDVMLSLKQLCKHKGCARRAVVLDRLESGRRPQRRHGGFCDHVRRRGGELHAAPGAVAGETMDDVKILLEMVLQHHHGEGVRHVVV